MTETGTPATASPARESGAGASKQPSIRLARDELRLLFKRYYDLLGFNAKEREGRIDVFEAGSASPVFSYVFDRKTFTRNPDAKLVTFNSQELEHIIDTIKTRGKIARAYMPFEFDPKAEFQRAIEKLVSKAGVTGGFVNNGTIQLVKHSIGYVPFLMIITRIDFSSVDASTEIERLIIPLIDQGKLPDKIRQRISYYIDKLDKYFYSEDSRLVNHMPVAGELLDISDEQIEALVDEATPKLLESIKSRTIQVEGKLQARLQKENDIIESYYKQLKLETANAIEAAREKREKDKVQLLEETLAGIEKEQQFKTGEVKSIYSLHTQFEVLGAAAVYIPIFFQFQCKIRSVYGDVDCLLDYNIFDKEIIQPTCTCGNPIYQGHVCSNRHFSCTGCVGICTTCKADICSACKPRRCKECNTLLCTTHAIECDCCSADGTENRWTCSVHVKKCDLCGKLACRDCSGTCKECGRTTCSYCGIYECKACNSIACKDHAHECAVCAEAGERKRWTCSDHAHKCAFCGRKLCTHCRKTCTVCGRVVCDDCGTKKCSICGRYACKDHVHECTVCARKGTRDPWICENHARKCSGCQSDLCTTCASICSVCGKHSCADCGAAKCQACGCLLCAEHAVPCKSCEVEGKKNPMLCPSDAKKCDVCGQATCKQHLSGNCSACGKVSCPECGIFTCKVCGTPLCKEHAHECIPCKEKGVSNAHVCNTHVARCHSCGKELCNACKVQCAQCGRISCIDCGSIQCKKCGKQLCQDHALACDKCTAAGKANDWSCAEHVVRCDVCKRQLCIKCEPAIARCVVCNKAICSDCKPHRCKDCINDTCDEHHGECMICKAMGKFAIETCVDHTYTCKSCGKIVCKKHSIACNVCHDIFCTDEQCSSKAGEVCLPHSFISALDGSRHSINSRQICVECHLAYTGSQMDDAYSPRVCSRCKLKTKDEYYLYMRRTGKMLAFPDFLDMPGDDTPEVILVKDRPYKIATRQRGVAMAENFLALIFAFDSREHAHTLVHVKATGVEILYSKPKVLLPRRKIAPEIVLKQRVLVDQPSSLPARVQQPSAAIAETPAATAPMPGASATAVTPPDYSKVLVKVQKLFAASIRIKLDMLRRIVGMEEAEFRVNIQYLAPGNGLAIENEHVIVAKSDASLFQRTLNDFFLKRDARDIQ